MILGIDTSTALTSVALLDHEHVIAQESHWDPRRHAEIIGPMLAKVLATTDRSLVSRVVCGVGPGPYTGLRVGIAVARAVGLAWEIPVVGVCSLDAIAAAAAADGRFGDVLVATDARRSEVYWASYDASGTRTDGPRVEAAEEIEAPGSWLGYGSLLHGRLDESLIALAPTSPLLSPTGEWVARLGRQGEASTAPVDLSVHGGDGSSTAEYLRGRIVLVPEPLYLRRPDAIAHHSVATGVVS